MKLPCFTGTAYILPEISVVEQQPKTIPSIIVPGLQIVKFRKHAYLAGVTCLNYVG